MEQVVLLTGGTGSLGSCLLYKLALQLPAAKIYVLCRGTVNEAVQKWEFYMAEQIDDILDSGKVHCIRGNLNRDGFGLDPDDLKRLQEEVTVVIHAAADISLAQSLPDSIQSDCLPVIRIASLVQSFKAVKLFAHISSTFAQMHLSAGVVPERIVKVADDEPPPQTQLASILRTGKSPYAHHFITPYAQAKYLAEQLLMEYHDSFPILIVRPSSISPAVSDPFPQYGPDGAIPLHTFVTLALARGYDVLEIINGLPQEFILDEIPVDLVANTCLLHVAAGTTGVVHAAAQLYETLTVAEYVSRARKYAPKDVVERIAANGTKQGQPRQLPLDFHGLLMEEWRDWIFDCQRSKHLKNTPGPIGLQCTHVCEEVFRERVERWSKRLGVLL
ncbi:male sterility protein [Hirsutella rhossiliensis]|uniref:Fatty acyl-CoA reductase n=1 Tax=Hirsutella rhossiliensis TaxID=111463 RepID=A0A9P8MSF5_9HYPO|nr:male sterility protein [Hirsutella rhossiliensis]KAH0961118.1 male sterility protein [Hirsutella rhossiliensis]